MTPTAPWNPGAVMAFHRWKLLGRLLGEGSPAAQAAFGRYTRAAGVGSFGLGPEAKRAWWRAKIPGYENRGHRRWLDRRATPPWVFGVSPPMHVGPRSNLREHGGYPWAL